MRVLYCSYSIIPSSYANAIAVMNQCAALSKEVDFRALLVKGNQRNIDVFQEYAVSKFPLLRLPKCFLRHKELGLRIAMLIYIRLWHPDIVYSRDILLNECLCKMGIPNSYEIHQIDMDNQEFDILYKDILLKIKDSIYLKSIVSISNTLKKECIKFGVPKEKISVLHSGVNINKQNNSNEIIDIPEFREILPLAVYVGSLQSGKGIETILKMAEATKSYNFLIVGGCKGAIQETGNLKHISQVHNEMARRYMERADFLLLPMTKQKYQFHSPLKLFEYLAAAKPIIASNNENLAEILEDRKNVMFANEDNPLDFLKCMDEVRADNKLRQRLCENSRKLVSKFTWEKRALAIHKLLEDVILQEKSR